MWSGLVLAKFFISTYEICQFISGIHENLPGCLIVNGHKFANADFALILHNFSISLFFRGIQNFFLDSCVIFKLIDDLFIFRISMLD